VLKLGLFVLSGTIALLSVELFLRLSGVDQGLVWAPHPKLGWWHIPGAKRLWTEEGRGLIAINGAGMRDVERSEAKSEGVFRIAVFGDSMTEGVQVNLDQTFCQQLEQRFRARGRHAEVLNFGVNGYSPLQELLLYESVGRAFRPDLVVQAIFLDNDVADLHPALASGQQGAPFLTSSVNGRPSVDYSAAEASFRDYRRQPIAALRSYSAGYRLVSAARWSRIDRRAFDAARAGDGVPRRYHVYRERPDAKWDVAWERLEQVVKDFSRQSRGQGAAYAVLVVPAGQLVYPAAWETLQTQFPAMRRERWNLDGPRERLAGLAGKHDITIIDVHDQFVQSRNEAPLFFGHVGHMTPEGHRVMAGALERALTPLVASRSGNDPEIRRRAQRR
jgi:lysophospholipase L1-like esterase